MNKKQKTLTDAEREAYSLVGRHGGRAMFKKHGREHMSKIGKQGARSRMLKKSAEKAD